MIMAEPAQKTLTPDQLTLVPKIARRLKRWYDWVGLDDLMSYAYIGLVLASDKYCPERGVPFEVFAFRKATYEAIDEMRKDRVLRRASAAPLPALRELHEGIPDKPNSGGLATVEQREICGILLSRIRERDRRLLLLRYKDGMTFKEISEVLGISESGACLRHRALMKRLRAMAKTLH